MNAVIRFGTVCWGWLLSDSMSVYRLLLWCSCHPAIWDPEVQSSDCKRWRRVRQTPTGEVLMIWTDIPDNVGACHCHHQCIYIYYKGSQDMAYWHDWWNQLTGFQRQLILLMSMADDFWSSLTEGQRTVTGSFTSFFKFMLVFNIIRCFFIVNNFPCYIFQVSLQ